MTDEAVRLSVIVAAYNAEGTIARCLRSLTTQDCEAPFEIIVVNSSNDRTAELVARDFPDVRLFTFEERKFPGDARNLGVARARGDVISRVVLELRRGRAQRPSHAGPFNRRLR